MADIFNNFLDYTKQNPGTMTLNVILSLTFPVNDFIIPYYTKHIIDLANRKKPFIKYLIILVSLLTALTIVSTLSSWHDAYVIPKLQNYIKHDIIKNTLETFEYSYKTPNIGELISRIVKIPLIATHVFEQIKNFLLPNFLSFTVTSLYIIALDWKIGIVTFISIILIFLLVTISPLICLEQTHKQDRSLSKIDDEAEDIFKNLDIIYINDQKLNELDRISKYENIYEENYKYTVACTMKYRALAICILAAMMSYFIYRSRDLSIGTFIAILMILANWYTITGWIIDNIKDQVIEWGILTSYSHLKRVPVNTIDSKNITIDQDGIFLSNLVYRIGDKDILKNINFYIPPGMHLGIIGEIGSGKSTLLKLLLGLYKPTSGAIFMHKYNTAYLNRKQLNKLISYVPQNPVLFKRTVYENIVYGQHELATDSREYINEILKDFDIGLDKVSGLSGGQKQVVAIIRAFVTNPEIIILDEITSSIDKKTKDKIMTLLHQLFEKKTVIIVTHDPELLKFANFVCTMKDGGLYSPP